MDMARITFWQLFINSLAKLLNASIYKQLWASWDLNCSLCILAKFHIIKDNTDNVVYN